MWNLSTCEGTRWPGGGQAEAKELPGKSPRRHKGKLRAGRGRSPQDADEKFHGSDVRDRRQVPMRSGQAASAEKAELGDKAEAGFWRKPALASLGSGDNSQPGATTQEQGTAITKETKTKHILEITNEITKPKSGQGNSVWQQIPGKPWKTTQRWGMRRTKAVPGPASQKHLRAQRPRNTHSSTPSGG